MRSLVISIAIAFALTGCDTVPQFRSFRPSGEDKNLGIEVLQHTGVHLRYELIINGEYVTEMKTTMDYHPQAFGVYQGKKIEMRGDFFPGRGFAIDVFVDGEHAANFNFF